MLQQLRLFPHLLKLVGPLHLIKVLYIIQRVQQHHPQFPHYYLQILGVHPEQQGQGWAKQVLTPIFKFCKQQQLPCYLETATASNVGLYLKLGFEVIYHLQDLPYQAPEIWEMLRPATIP